MIGDKIVDVYIKANIDNGKEASHHYASIIVVLYHI
jgi:hypothetical protein